MVADGYKQTEIGVIPEDWKIKALSESFKFKNGLNKAKEFFIPYCDLFLIKNANHILKNAN